MPSFEYAVTPTLPQERARIFRFARPRVSAKAILELAQRFGLSGNLKSGSISRDERMTTYAEGQMTLAVHHASGGFRFHDKSRWQVDDGRSNVEFDDAAAVDLAERLLEANDMPPRAERSPQRVTRLNVGVADKRTGLAELRVIDVGVPFARVVDDLPVEGPGGKLVVYIDGGGKLTGIDRLWREIREDGVQDVALRSPEAVLKDAEREWAGSGSGVVRIDEIRFGYFELGWDAAQRYLQPAYVVSMTIKATEGHFRGREVMRAEYWGSACETPPERLLPARYFASPQTLRRASPGAASN